MGIEYGIVGLILLILNIWAIIQIIGSNSGNGEKLLWVLGILFFPLIGIIVWWFTGPKS